MRIERDVYVVYRKARSPRPAAPAAVKTSPYVGALFLSPRGDRVSRCLLGICPDLLWAVGLGLWAIVQALPLAIDSDDHWEVFDFQAANRLCAEFLVGHQFNRHN